jgi:hypothetical protein
MINRDADVLSTLGPHIMNDKITLGVTYNDNDNNNV